MITVSFFTTLRLMLSIREIEVKFTEGMTILDVLNLSEEIIKEKLSKRFIWKLLTENGEIIRGTIIMINGKNILDSDGLACTVSEGDAVALFPPGGGG